MSQPVIANAQYNPDVRVPKDLAHEPVNAASLLESIQPLTDSSAYFNAVLEAGINKMQIVYGLSAMRAYSTAVPNQMVYCQGTGIYICENTTVSEPEPHQLTITGTGRRWTNVAGLSAFPTIATSTYRALAAVGDRYRLLNTGRTRMVSYETGAFSVPYIASSSRTEAWVWRAELITSEIPPGSKLEFECYASTKGVANDIVFDVFYGDASFLIPQNIPSLTSVVSGEAPGYFARSSGLSASYTPIFGTAYQAAYAAANTRAFALIVYGAQLDFPVYFKTRVTVQEPV